MINQKESQKGFFMNLATRAYELFKDDETKARGMAEIFEIIEDRFLPKADSATKADVKQSQLELTLEIEKVRSETEKIKIETEKVRSDLKIDIEKVKTDLMKHMNRQVIWIISAISIITASMVGLLKLLDFFIK